MNTDVIVLSDGDELAGGETALDVIDQAGPPGVPGPKGDPGDVELPAILDGGHF